MNTQTKSNGVAAEAIARHIAENIIRNTEEEVRGHIKQQESAQDLIEKIA